METSPLVATLAAGPLDRRIGGYLLLAFGILLLVAAELARRQRKKTSDEALRLIEGILLFFAALCFALAKHRLAF
jgi:hypothetical protein